jgi:hypothetical protein
MRVKTLRQRFEVEPRFFEASDVGNRSTLMAVDRKFDKFEFALSLAAVCALATAQLAHKRIATRNGLVIVAS